MQTIKTIPFKHIPILYNLNLYTNFIHSNLSHKICLQVQVQFIGALLKNNLNFGEPSTMGTGMSCLNFVLFFVSSSIQIQSINCAIVCSFVKSFHASCSWGLVYSFCNLNKYFIFQSCKTLNVISVNVINFSKISKAHILFFNQTFFCWLFSLKPSNCIVINSRSKGKQTNDDDESARIRLQKDPDSPDLLVFSFGTKIRTQMNSYSDVDNNLFDQKYCFYSVTFYCAIVACRLEHSIISFCGWPEFRWQNF